MAKMQSESGQINGELLFQQPYRGNAPTLIKGRFRGLEPNRTYWVGIVEYGNLTEGCKGAFAHHPPTHHLRAPWVGTLGMVQQAMALIGLDPYLRNLALTSSWQFLCVKSDRRTRFIFS